jgi:soluble cytochrome b562
MRDRLKPYHTAAAVNSLASPPPITLAAKSAKQAKNTAAAAARLIAKVLQSIPEKGAIKMNDSSKMSDIRLGIVMLKRSVNAAKARQSGSVRKMAAITTRETPFYSANSRRIEDESGYSV